MPDALHAYLLSVSEPLSPAQEQLRDETARHPQGGFQISAEQGQFMAFLIKLTGAKRCLEIGVFTGYSSLTVAQALPPDGTLLALDVSAEFTDIARRYFAQAGVAHKITLRIAPALDSLRELTNVAARHGTFDWVFVDADKPNYPAYYEAALTLLRPGGLLGIDNTLWSGKVADETAQDDATQGFRALNAFIAADERVDRCVIPIGDGLTLCRKR